MIADDLKFVKQDDDDFPISLNLTLASLSRQYIYNMHKTNLGVRLKRGFQWAFKTCRGKGLLSFAFS
jgi:hypothetical protein